MTALALHSQSVAIELHSLLRDLDPARWRDELALSATARLDGIRRELDDLLASADGDPLSERLGDVAALLSQYCPSEAHVREEWMRLRAAVWPAYEALAVTLRQSKVHVPSLRPTNYTRNLFHTGMGLGAILLAEALPLWQCAILAGAAAAAGWTMEAARRVSPAVNRTLMRLFHPVAHPHEAHRVNSASWYTSAVFLLALTGDVRVGVAALAVVAFGDPAAALVGRRFGRTPLAQGRSLEGTVAGIGAGFVAAAAVLVLGHPELSVPVALLTAAAAATAGLVAEVVVRAIDDNLSIPLAAAAAAWAVLAVFA